MWLERDGISKMKNRFFAWLRNSYIFVIIALTYIPLIIVMILSFTEPSIKGNLNLGFNFNGGENWLNLFKNDEFINAITNTAIIVSLTVPISTIIATVTCFGIWNTKQIYSSSVIGTSKFNMVVPDVITGIGLALLFSITIIPLSINLGFATVVLSHISFCTPYAIVVIYPRMQKMNKNLILASMDLGYSQITTFFKVTVPFLLPSILSGAAIVFSLSFDDFIITKLVGGSVSTISTELYSMAKGIKMWAVTFGAIIVLISLLITVIIGVKKYVSKVSKNKEMNLKRFSNKIDKKFKVKRV